MRRLIWINGITGLVLMALFIGSFAFAKKPFFPTPPTFSDKITQIQDIEHLHQIALLLERNNSEIVHDMNEIVTAGVELAAALSLFCAVFFIINCLTLFKHIRIAEGRPPKWLHWL